MKGIILSATSDIATEMALKWNADGWDLVGTYHSKHENFNRLMKKQIPLTYCDFGSNASIETAAEEIKILGKDWDFILFATGTQYPVGAFETIKIDEWIQSVNINFASQMKLLHLLLPYRKLEGDKSVLFFAGGGTNNPVDYYSAYTISKIALIKMCELLDSEIRDVKFSIIGPGWVKTKIHDITLKAGPHVTGLNFEKTQEKLNSNQCVPIGQVIESFEWILSQPKNIVGGRNFSTVFDQWGSKELCELLAKNKDMYKLRRCENNALVKPAKM